MKRSEELRARRAALITEARVILEAHPDEASLPAEEEARYTKLMDEAAALLKRAEREEQHEAEAAAPETRVERPAPEAPEAPVARATATPEYRAAFLSYLATGTQTRALSVGTNADGGFTVPEEFEASILAVIRETTPMRGLSRVLTIANDRKFPLVTAHTTAAWTAEAVAYTETTPTFDQIEIEALKAAAIAKVSEELLADSAIDMEAFLRDEFAESIGVLENTAYTVGNGTTQPQGVVGRASAGVTAAATADITADEVIDLYHSLKAGYRARATFMTEDATVKVLRKKKTSDGQYLWQPGLQASQPDTLLGRPLVTNEDIASLATGATTMLFGDFSRFYICDRAGIAIQRLNELYAANGQVGFRVFHRTDSNLLLTEAVKKLVQA